MARHTPKKLEPIRYDELLNNSSMEGLVSFINYHPESRPTKISGLVTVDDSSTVGIETTEDNSSTADEKSSVGKSSPDPAPENTVVFAHELELLTEEGLAATQVNSGRTVDESSPEAYNDELAYTVDDSSSVVEAASVVESSPTSIKRPEAESQSPASRLHEEPSSPAPANPTTVDDLSSVDDLSVGMGSFGETLAPRTEPKEAINGTTTNSAGVGRNPTVDASKIVLLQQAIREGRTPKELAPVWVSLASGQLYESRKVQPVKIAQHSMTTGQERFYEAIWKAKPDPRFRIEAVDRHQKRFRSGYDILARITRMADRNVQKNVPQLIAKKILHGYGDFDSSNRQGTTYDVFSYDMILQRQRAAGLCYVVKVGPGVEFVVPQGWTADRASTDDKSSTVDENRSVDNTSRADQISTETVDKASRTTVDQTSTPLDKRRKAVNRQATSTPGMTKLPPASLWEGFRRLDPDLDDGAITRIWRTSRLLVPDITPEEVLELFEARARVVYKIRSLENPRGVLLTSIQDWISPRKVEARREQLRHEAEEMERIRRELEQQHY